MFKNKDKLHLCMKWMKSAVGILIAVNIFFFILQLVLGLEFTSAFMLIGSDVFSRPWILLTSMFLHGGFAHLLFNMYVLGMFGSLVEQKIGTKRFVLIYFISGLIASFGSSFFYERALGASGAIMGIIGVLIMVMPNLRVLFFFAIPMRLATAAIIIIGLDVLGVFYPTGIGSIAHLIGVACGLGYGYYLRGQHKTHQKKFSSKTHLEESDIDEYLRNGRL